MRVTLQLESLDNRITPSGAHGGGGVEWITGASVPVGHGGEVAHVRTQETDQPGVDPMSRAGGSGVEV